MRIILNSPVAFHGPWRGAHEHAWREAQLGWDYPEWSARVCLICWQWRIDTQFGVLGHSPLLGFYNPGARPQRVV